MDTQVPTVARMLARETMQHMGGKFDAIDDAVKWNRLLQAFGEFAYPKIKEYLGTAGIGAARRKEDAIVQLLHLIHDREHASQHFGPVTPVTARTSNADRSGGSGSPDR